MKTEKLTASDAGKLACNSQKFRTNQTDWMIQTWDIGDGHFTDYWPVSTWSKHRRAGLAAARQCLEQCRGKDRMPRFTVRHLRDKDIKSLRIPVVKFPFGFMGTPENKA